MEGKEGSKETDQQKKKIYLADWGSRFLAWLIDIILVNVFWSWLAITILGLFSLPSLGTFWDLEVGYFETFGLSSHGIVMFIYWTLFEGYHGKSIGKMALNLQVTNRKGEKIGYGKAVIESLGKAFLLPLDCLIGWIAMPREKQRLFNSISDTIVIKRELKPPKGVEYVKGK